MSRFEEIGIQRQLESKTKSEAVKKFSNTCKTCCYKNIRVSCDRCAIAHIHSKLVIYLEGLRV